VALYKVVDNVDTAFASDIDQFTDALSGANDVGAITLFKQISPPSAPTVAVNAASGNLNGAYKYAVAFVTGYWKGQVGTGTLQVQGNTGGGATSITVSPASQKVDITNIPIGPTGTVARVIYRTKANGSTFYFLTQINDNTTTTFTDNVADTALGAQMPSTNTTGTSFSVGNLTVDVLGNLTTTGTGSFSTITSTVATGTAPFTVSSTTVVTNLNADMVDGLHASSFAQLGQANTFTGNITAPVFISNVSTGTAPLQVTSTTAVTNLNADMVDGLHASSFAQLGTANTFTQNQTAPVFISNASTGTAPLQVTSTTKVTNLNADMVDGYHFNQSLQTTDSPTFASVTATTFNGSLSGNASTATKLQTARTISLSGDVTASGVSFDGSSNITVSTTIANKGVANGIATLDSSGKVPLNQLRAVNILQYYIR
jgi:hypothetical protein